MFLITVYYYKNLLKNISGVIVRVSNILDREWICTIFDNGNNLLRRGNELLYMEAHRYPLIF